MFIYTHKRIPAGAAKFSLREGDFTVGSCLGKEAGSAQEQSLCYDGIPTTN